MPDNKNYLEQPKSKPLIKDVKVVLKIHIKFKTVATQIINK